MLPARFRASFLARIEALKTLGSISAVRKLSSALYSTPLDGRGQESSIIEALASLRSDG
jgi:hypothetical protein